MKWDTQQKAVFFLLLFCWVSLFIFGRSSYSMALEALTQPQPFDSSKLRVRTELCKQTIADAWWFLWPVKAEIWTSPYNRYSMVWKLWTHIAAVLPLALRVLEPVQDLPIFSFSVKNILITKKLARLSAWFWAFFLRTLNDLLRLG